MFERGTFVVGKEGSGYSYTNYESLSMVLDHSRNGYMYVIILEANAMAPDASGCTYDDFCETVANCNEAVRENKDCAYNLWIVKEDDFIAMSLDEWQVYKHTVGFEVNKNPVYDNIMRYREEVLMVSSDKSTEDKLFPDYAPPVIHTDGTYEYTNDHMSEIIGKTKELLDKFNHRNSYTGLGQIWKVHANAKQGINAILSKDPHWNPDAQAIVFEGKYDRKIDAKGIENFCNWALRALTDWGLKRQPRYYCCTVKELKEAYDRLTNLSYYIRNILAINGVGGIGKNTILINGMTYEELKAEENRIYELYSSAKRGVFCVDDYKGGSCFYLNEKDYIKYQNCYEFIRLIKRQKESLADETFADKANKYAKPFNFFDKKGKEKGLGAVAGQKISKIVNKFFQNYDFDKIVDKKVVATWTTTNDDGEVTTHRREQDMGWNKQFALFGDAINPLEITRWTVISTNLLDYLTMSFGNGWRSCQTIDKENTMDVDDSHNYEGMYCSGTLSYALDKSSVIMYTVDGSYNGTEWWKQPKVNRCMFHIGEDKFIQGRLYPDGRDGGDDSLSAQFRNIFQKVLADCVEEANLWKRVKGTSVCSRNSISKGTHYRDYECYSDSSISYLKRNMVLFNEKKIEIGHKPICPYCGNEHTSSSWLACSKCREGVTCDNCGCILNDDTDRIYDEDREVYLCRNCAESLGVEYCENVDEWHSEYIYYDNWSERWFYDRYEEDGVHFTSGYEDYHYEDYDNAEADGWHEIDGKWYNENDDEICQCDNCDEWILVENAIERDGNYYCEGCASALFDDEEGEDLLEDFVA